MKLRSVLSFAVFALAATVAFADDWPQWRGLNRDGVWHESGLIEKFAGEQIPIKWQAEIGSGYSGPTVAKGRSAQSVSVPNRLTDQRAREPESHDPA